MSRQEMIPRIESPISYAEFASHYLSENKPCIFANWITAKWAGCRDFALPGSPNAVNISALRKIYGHRDNVAVSDCLAENYGYASASKMNFSDFLDTWESGKCLYLKDFHFKRDALDYAPYEVPVYFRSDWMNEFWDATTGGSDDFRFIYAGPAGTWTPLHCDVIKSNSWSANLVGVKRWLLFPPGEIKKLEPLVAEKQEPDMDKLAQMASSVVAAFYDIIQNPGEIIFVPSEWGHQVRNETDVVSLNHNWLNAFNVEKCFNCLADAWRQTERDLRDFGIDDKSDDFQEKVEQIVESSTGCSLKTFIELIAHVAKSRLAMVNNCHQVTEWPSSSKILELGEIVPGNVHHAALDLQYIQSLIDLKMMPFLNERNLPIYSGKLREVCVGLKT